MSISIDSAVTTTEAAWGALHVHYAGNLNPMLLECVEPLVRGLRQEGLLDRYFFIRYWLGGPHLRLRLLPTDPGFAAEVDRRAQESISAFLERRPALYDINPDDTQTLYKQLFLFEYSQAEWDERYGPQGVMPLEPNNTVVAAPYEPEYDRYGGVAGVRLAEWQFEQSSDMVVRLVKSSNLHVRTVTLGVSAQLSLVMAFAFLRTSSRVVDFFRHYALNWSRVEAEAGARDFEDRYQRSAGELRTRVRKIHAAVVDGKLEELASFARDWTSHCVELGRRVREHTERGELLFPTQADAGVRAPVTDPAVSMWILISGYVHMTNNRLGVTIQHEAYLAYILRRAVEDFAAEEDL
jgi:hypothetical protein